MYPIEMKGKTGLIFGVANKRSIAWAIAQALDRAGARLAFTYQNERIEPYVRKLTDSLEGSLTLQCELARDEEIETAYREVEREFGGLDYLLHSVAYAAREDLEGSFLDTSRGGFASTLEVSAYSLIAIVRHAVPLMEKRGGGSVVAMTFIASERVFPGYNVMGSAKASLEHAIRQLAFELGEKSIRVNGISAGPLSTLAARGIKGFTHMLQTHREKAPLKRNITHEEVAKTALYLLSDLASGVTGEVIHVDAGYHIMGV